MEDSGVLLDFFKASHWHLVWEQEPLTSQNYSASTLKHPFVLLKGIDCNVLTPLATIKSRTVCMAVPPEQSELVFIWLYKNSGLNILVEKLYELALVR